MNKEREIAKFLEENEEVLYKFFKEKTAEGLITGSIRITEEEIKELDIHSPEFLRQT
jgi:hypothetical protein